MTEEYYSLLITRNSVSYGKLDLKVYGLKYKNNRRALFSLTTGKCVFDVAMCNNVIFLETQNMKLNDEMINTIMAAIDEETKKKYEDNVHVGTLMYFHQRFGNLACDTIEKMARESYYGIWLSDKQLLTCVMCEKAKQMKNTQIKRKRRALTN